MVRHLRIALEKRGVSCLARLSDEDAPRTADLIWNALPLEGDAWHAKYAMNEVYTLVPPLVDEDIGLENSTLTPVPGDIVYFYFPKGHLARTFREEKGVDGYPGVVDLAIFYGRNNFLFNPATGYVPGNVFATVVEDLEAMAAACHDVWRSGSVDERLSFKRVVD